MSHIEIITIGDELIEGRLVDTNAGLMSERLAAKGLTVVSHLSVGDDLARISDALRAAADRSDAVLVSGGLGPTSDDLTAEAAAAAFGLPIERSFEALEHVRGFFHDRGRRMTANNEKQADLPKGCTLLPNPGGTAVGFRLRIGDCRLYFMPGVPKELDQIFTDSVLPNLRSFLSGAAPMVVTLKVFGKGESEVAQMLDGIEADLPAGVDLTVQYRASFPEIHVRLVVNGEDASAQTELERLTADARNRLGTYLFATGGAVVETSFPDAVVDRARGAGITVAIADGCTGGELTRLICRTDHGPELLGGALIAPTFETLIQRLAPMTGDAVPCRTVEAVATGIREQFKATTGIAISGSPLHSDGSPLGRLEVAISTDDVVSSRELSFPIDSDRFRRLAAYVALAMLVRAIDSSRT